MALISCSVYAHRLTYPYLCLPVITGNIAKHIGVLLQANIRKAGTVGTPSVPRTTTSSTVGTVGGTGAGARRVTCLSSLSCVHLPSVVPPVFTVICRPSVLAVILLAAPSQTLLDIPDQAAAHPLINCT